MADDKTSILGSLRGRREQLVEANRLVLAVPRWRDPEVFVRYRPVDHTLLRKVQARIEKAPPKHRSEEEVNAHADILISACDGVFAKLEEGGLEYSLNPDDPTGPPTRFDDDLARNLGLEDATARQVVRKLFLTDGDIIGQATKLSQWSGYVEQDADETLEGE